MEFLHDLSAKLSGTIWGWPEIFPAMVAALLVTATSLSWTNARKAATDGGTRVGSTPRLDESILLRTLTIDYEIVRERANRLCDRLDRAAEVRVTTAAGSDVTFSIEGRIAHGRKGGIYREPGQWGNLPCGEAFVAPVEGSGRGVYVVDASHGGVELYNLCLDGAALTTVADSFAALEQRVDQAVVVIEALLVHCALALRPDARPGGREGEVLGAPAEGARGRARAGRRRHGLAGTRPGADRDRPGGR